MTSPFEGRDNATLYFKVATTQMEPVAGTVNIVPVVGELELRVMLSRPKRDARVLQLPGPDRLTVPFQGRAIDPFYWPDAIRMGHRGRCQLRDALTGNTQDGDFEITLVAQSPFSEVTEALGTAFEGLFTAASEGETVWSN